MCFGLVFGLVNSSIKKMRMECRLHPSHSMPRPYIWQLMEAIQNFLGAATWCGIPWKLLYVFLRNSMIFMNLHLSRFILLSDGHCLEFEELYNVVENWENDDHKNIDVTIHDAPLEKKQNVSFKRVTWFLTRVGKPTRFIRKVSKNKTKSLLDAIIKSFCNW